MYMVIMHKKWQNTTYVICELLHLEKYHVRGIIKSSRGTQQTKRKGDQNNDKSRNGKQSNGA